MTDLPPESRPVRLAEGPVVYLPHEELGLIDVAVVMVRRWMWIAAGLVVVWATTYWWLSQAPVRYESRGAVKIGHSRVSFPIIPTKDQQDVLLEPTPVAALRVFQEYAAHSPLGQKHGGAYVSATSFEKGADELLVILARAPSPEAARDFLDAVLTEFVADHKSLYAEERQVIEERLQAIEKQQERIAAELAGTETPAVKPDDNPALLAVRQLSRAQILQQNLSLEQEAVRLRREILNLQSPPTERISNPTLQTFPVEPRRSITWGVGTGLGLLLGCGMAFSVEFLQQVRRRLRAESHTSDANKGSPAT